MTNENMTEQGFSRESLKVVRFHDSNTTFPWFYRDVEEIGTVLAWMDGAVPCDRKELLAVVLDAFGPDAYVIY